MDAPTRIKTLIVCLLAIFAVYMIFSSNSPAHTGIWCALLLLMLLLIFKKWHLAPYVYGLDDDCIVIADRVTEVRIPLSEVKKISRMEEISTPWYAGGIFARTGRHSDVTFSVTNRRHAVLIEAKQKYIITPAEPDKFVPEVQALLGKK